MTMTIVAVYGSLKKGFSNHDFLVDADYLADAKVKGWDMYSFGPYPMAVPGDGTIAVELYAVDSQTLRSLDGLEGYPRFYDRKVVECWTEWCPVEAWMYFGTPDQVERLPQVGSGVWTEQSRQPWAC